jgi:hypothetical protein
VAAAALYHDASEILTGDLPTPIKYFNPAIKAAYKDVEAVAEEKLLDMLPPELRGAYAERLSPGGGEVRTGAGKGGGQALRLHQVRGGAQGREQRVPPGRRADPCGAGGV